jgi:hypothetical protein
MKAWTHTDPHYRAPTERLLHLTFLHTIMTTYFDTIKKVSISSTPLAYAVSEHSFSLQSFADVPVTDAGVNTVAFLEAAEGLVGLFGAHRHTIVSGAQCLIQGWDAQICLDRPRSPSCNLI